MKVEKLNIKELLTERLILMPFTLQICRNLLDNDFSDLDKMGLVKGKNWPDDDVIETLPKIMNNLSRLEAPTGFESWMIIKKESLEVIGDAGFKGFNFQKENADIGYGIIKEERRKGYAEEALRALLNWAFSNKIVKEITANCSLDNTGSARLLKKLHFMEIFKDDEMVYWSLQNKLFR